MDVNAFIGWFLTHIQSVDALTRDLIAGGAIMLETSLFLGLVIPGDSVVLIAATGVSGILDGLGLVALVLLGSMIGETAGFWVGRIFGERIRASRLGQRIGERYWQMADTFVVTRGGLAVAISRFLPVLHSLVPVVAGMTRMRYRTFIAWTVAACAIWASAYVGVGYAARTGYEQVAGGLKWAGLLFVGVLVLFLVLAHFGKKRLERTAERMVAEGEAALAARAGGTVVNPEEPVN